MCNKRKKTHLGIELLCDRKHIVEEDLSELIGSYCGIGTTRYDGW